MNNIMIDLETLDVKPSAIILTLGAVKFDPDTGELGEVYYNRFNRHLQTNRTMSDDTVWWWGKQNENVYDEAFTGLEDLEICLLASFKEFLGGKPIVWGNGSTFDISILGHAYNYNPPWNFYDVRDVRTVVAMAKGFVSKHSFKFEGKKHNALDDAIHQAKYVSAMWKWLKNREVCRHA